MLKTSSNAEFQRKKKPKNQSIDSLSDRNTEQQNEAELILPKQNLWLEIAQFRKNQELEEKDQQTKMFQKKMQNYKSYLQTQIQEKCNTKSKEVNQINTFQNLFDQQEKRLQEQKDKYLNYKNELISQIRHNFRKKKKQEKDAKTQELRLQSENETQEKKILSQEQAVVDMKNKKLKENIIFNNTQIIKKQTESEEGRSRAKNQEKYCYQTMVQFEKQREENKLQMLSKLEQHQDLLQTLHKNYEKKTTSKLEPTPLKLCTIYDQNSDQEMLKAWEIEEAKARDLLEKEKLKKKQNQFSLVESFKSAINLKNKQKELDKQEDQQLVKLAKEENNRIETEENRAKSQQKEKLKQNQEVVIKQMRHTKNLNKNLKNAFQFEDLLLNQDILKKIYEQNPEKFEILPINTVKTQFF